MKKEKCALHLPTGICGKFSCREIERNSQLVLLPPEYQFAKEPETYGVRSINHQNKLWAITCKDLPAFTYTKSEGWNKITFEKAPKDQPVSFCGTPIIDKNFFNIKNFIPKVDDKWYIGVDPASKDGDKTAISAHNRRSGFTYVTTLKPGETPEEGLRRAGYPSLADSIVRKKDMVNNPAHYNQGKIEVYDFIEDQKLNYAEGCVVKYVCRHKHKGAPLQDLKKAEWYLKKIIKELEAKNAERN